MRVLVCLPALDLPFKRPALVHDGLRRAFAGGDIASLRGWWRVAAERFVAAFRAAGHEAALLERPNWELTPRLIDFYGADVAFVPHRLAEQCRGLRTPALYWMQLYCRFLFTADPAGWGATAASYGSEAWRRVAPDGAFERYRERLVRAGASKLAQPPACGRAMPAPGYIFFPCQIPHDETLRFHADIDEAALLGDLARWAEARQVRLVVKPHPANPTSIEPLRAAAPESAFVRWEDANIHALIAGAAAVYTINSGVGFEALLHDRPVLTFGRTPYDAVTRRGDAGDLDESWELARAPLSLDERTDIRRWLTWFTRDVAVDLERPDLDGRLASLVAQGEKLAGVRAAA